MNAASSAAISPHVAGACAGRRRHPKQNSAPHPHVTAAASEGEDPGPPTANTSQSTAQPVLAPGLAAAHFPQADVAKFRSIVADTLAKVRAGDQAGATARIKDLESAWDDDQDTLRPMDETAWTGLDGQIDRVLKALRASNPDPATETSTLDTLLTALG